MINDSDDDKDEKDTPSPPSLFPYIRGYLEGFMKSFVDGKILPQLNHVTEELGKLDNFKNKDNLNRDVRRYAEFLLIKGLLKDWKSEWMRPHQEIVETIWNYHKKNLPIHYASLLTYLEGEPIYHAEKEFSVDSLPSEQQKANDVLLSSLFFPTE